MSGSNKSDCGDYEEPKERRNIEKVGTIHGKEIMRLQSSNALLPGRDLPAYVTVDNAQTVD